MTILKSRQAAQPAGKGSGDHKSPAVYEAEPHDQPKAETRTRRRPITQSEIEAGKSSSGGFTYERLRSWGVSCPPRAGWRKKLLRIGVPGSCPYPEGFARDECADFAVEANPLMAFNKAIPQDVPEGAVAIFTDGSCDRGAGGWGFVCYRGVEELHSACGAEAATTNNRMELVAVINALRWLDPSRPAIVWTDSQYVARGALELRHGWQKTSWSRSEPIAHLELWRCLADLVDRRVVEIRWLRGHAGATGNARADELAALGRRRLVEARS